MAGSKPLVSIGMPLYNEERYLGLALDSLLAQEYENFELIISDNASEDATQEICLAYASRDSRIRYYRSETNAGAIENFDRVFKLSRGEYFMWAAGHDIWEPTFISTCVPVLNEDPSVVLAYSQTALIDGDGKPIGAVPNQFDTQSVPGPVRRFILALWAPNLVLAIYGIFRSSILRRTHLRKNTVGLFCPDGSETKRREIN